MRSGLARVTALMTAVVALLLIVPLAWAVSALAADRAISSARAEVANLIPVVTVTTDRLRIADAIDAQPSGARRIAIYLPGGQVVGAGTVGPPSLTNGSRSVSVPGGRVVEQTIVTASGGTAVIEVFVPDGDLRRGVVSLWLGLIALGVLLVGVSVLLADRMALRHVIAARDLDRAARAFASDLTKRVEVSGTSELAEAGTAFNTMADRVVALLGAERELAADLSHRLRTPLTALRLDAEAIPPGPVATRIREAVDALEAEVDAIITDARSPARERSAEQNDLVDVLADRLAFWAVLAEDHRRPWRVTGAETPLWVPVPRDDLIGVVDALLGNVFEHTPQGTAFAVHVLPDRLIVEDGGPGIADVASALRRGESTVGSTGLGLSIVVRIAESVGGAIRVDRGELGGARIALILPLAV